MLDLRLEVSPVEGGQDTQEVAKSPLIALNRMRRTQQPPRNGGTPPVSLSPTSATAKLCCPPSSKLGRHALTPQRVLSTVTVS